LKELVARKALKGGGDSEKREAEKNQIKSSAFVNLHLVIMVRMNSPRTIRPKRIDPPQEAETAVPECEQIDEEAEQNQGQRESWHTFETP
jgi:hypothetical protein